MDIDIIHDNMLREISDEYKKTVGYPAWDITRAFALGVTALSDDVERAIMHTDVTQLTGEDLDNYVEYHKGIVRKFAEYAECELTVTSGNGTILAGDRFSTSSGIEFQAVEDVEVTDGDKVKIRALVAGAEGNVAANTIVYMPITLTGISEVTNESPAIGGADGETDETLLERFLYSLANPSNGANASSYKEWAESVEGVGRAKVYPLEEGNGTVTVRVTGADFTAPSTDVVTAVQQFIDPNQSGDGMGNAPIGAICTVKPAVAQAIDVVATVELESGYSVNEAITELRKGLESYFATLALKDDTVSYAKSVAIAVDSKSIADLTTMTLNGGSVSVSLGLGEIPVLATVKVNGVLG